MAAPGMEVKPPQNFA